MAGRMPAILSFCHATILNLAGFMGGAAALLCRAREGTAMRTGDGWFGRLTVHPALWAAVVIAGVVAWAMLPELSDADDDLASAPFAVIGATPVSIRSESAATPVPVMVTGAAEVQTMAPAAGEAMPEPRAEKPPPDGLRISSQSWRRGGLGSKALVTLTLRNANDYAVKDIEIACAFTRRDGSHLTDRRRVIGDIINTRSRKTYARLLVGFVNINANKAKCSLVTASRI